ncbi:MAG: transposase, partial [Kamptonema sp. SIO4C4]|nr:transposase [Kamptonema sp. SIO4C4]
EDVDFRIMAKGFLGKHSLDAGFGQFRTILKFVGKKRGVFVSEVDHKGTSQTCPNCRTTVRKELSDRVHSCPGCFYQADRDVASAQEICNRGIETYRGTPEKQEIGSQVEVSGAMCLDNWRRGAMPIREYGKPAL